MEGLRIKAIRKALKLSQSKLAAVLKVSRGAVYTWEAGEQNPTPVNLARIDDYARKKRLDLKKFPAYCPDCHKIGKLCENHSGKNGRCTKHRQYKAIMRPRTNCAACQQMWVKANG